MQRWFSQGFTYHEVRCANPRRVIHGIASTPWIDEHKHSLSSDGCVIKLPVPLMSEHAKVGGGVGEVFFVRQCSDQIYVRATVFETPSGNYAWQLIEAGEIACFSIGGKAGDANVIEAQVDGIKFWKSWELGEVSIVRHPANPTCGFEIYRGMDRPVFGGRAASGGVVTATGQQPPRRVVRAVDLPERLS